MKYKTVAFCCLTFLNISCNAETPAKNENKLSSIENKPNFKRSTTNSSIEKRLLPQDYKALSQEALLTILGEKDSCKVHDNEHNERFVQTFPLGEETLMALACETGAYQDSYLVYYLKKEGPSYSATGLNWELPIYKEKWILENSSKIAGSLEVTKLTGELTSLRLYSAFGSCGYQVSFSINPTTILHALKPLSVTADNDCENGVLVDAWPNIKL